MTGAIILVAILALSPLIITLSLVLVAAALGTLLHKDGEARHADSSLLETNT